MRVLTEAVAVMLVTPEGAVWLARRADCKLLECAGGAVNEGESIREAAARELREETGIDVEEHRLDFKGFIKVNGLNVYLYTVMLNDDELPAYTEPNKRGPWGMWTVNVALRGTDLMPSVGALLAILQHEGRGG